MGKKNNGYKEVTLDGSGFERHYRNPLTKLFQYEYALYETVSELFGVVKCDSRGIDTLKLYFKELPEKKRQEENPEDAEKKKKSQEDILSEMAVLVERDVVGKITFPMMNVCAAEVRVIPEKDGSHKFFFTDGIYGFSVQLVMKKRHPSEIKTECINSVKLMEDKTEKTKATLNGVA